VVSPLARIVQREAEIDAFNRNRSHCREEWRFQRRIGGNKEQVEPKPLFLPVKGRRYGKTMERVEKAEKAPALYDLTTLQRDANGFSVIPPSKPCLPPESMKENDALPAPTAAI
jgi:DNA topoisomerase-3